MGMIDDLWQQLNAAQEAAKRLTSKKKDTEKKRRDGELLQDDFKILRRKLNNAVDEVEENLRARTENIPGNFGKYYREQVEAGIRQGKIRDLDQQAGNILSSLMTRILDLDDVIEDLVRQIAEKNSFIRHIKNKLEELGEFVADIIPGGE